MTTGIPIEFIWQAIKDTVRDLEESGRKPVGATVKARSQIALGQKIIEPDYGFRNFKEIATAADQAGYVKIASLPADTDFTLASRNIEFDMLRKVVTHIVERGGDALGSRTKPLLTEALGGTFHESALGFRTFKEFCVAAQEAGYVGIVDDPQQSDFELERPQQVKLSPPTQPTNSGNVDTPDTVPLEEAFEELERIAREKHQAGKPLPASSAKDNLLKHKPGFSEKRLNYQRFTDLLRDAEQAGYVTLRERPGHGKSVIDVYPPVPEGIGFADIRFGFASAGAESVRNPTLLLEGFYDFRGVTEAVLNGSEYLVLGHKGSGKSAIGEHLVQKADHDPTLFVDYIDLKDFPYGTLSQLADDDSSQQIVRISWRWLLLLRVFQTMQDDAGANPLDANECQRLAKDLRKQGLIPSRNLSDLSLRSVSLALKGGLRDVAEASASAEYSTRQVQLTDAVGRLERIANGFQTQSRHIHVIDGLDELINPGDKTYSSLSALLGEIESLNDAFYRSDSMVKIVLLCRSDLYERLTSPNKNKLRQNFAINLRWSPEVLNEDIDDATLNGLISHRARLSGYVGKDPVRDLLPLKAPDGTDMWSYLVEHTRRTPRDLISLLTRIQKKAGRGAVTSNHIQRSLNDYSSEYFVPELKDELEGYIQPTHIESIFGVLSALRKRSFLLSELQDIATAQGSDVSIAEAVQVLFECSALGHDRSTGGRVHEFRFMNPNLSFNPQVPILVHRGAWWALNLAS
ncbi:hypothetical protein [Isoptericola sp. AK164]|uniref:P-loop ATPase, Sll1717 family n=1 Tax=Isoptericola sp. AK164 TaxID=3024246 RepID=UPI0024181D5A|nr:hypothetical protein [Isoptericola sp. AK164]